MLRRTRFRGAGSSADRQFKNLRRQNLRDGWKIWASLGGVSAAFCIWSAFAGEFAGRFLTFTAGCMIGVLTCLWVIGGHVSAVYWWIGAEGERETAREIEKLGPDWHCEHDVMYGHENWDHVLVGPPGVFLLDSKSLSSRASAWGDALRAGRLRYSGSKARINAMNAKHELDQRLGYSAGWVQGVMVVWGSFPQRHHQEGKVDYVAGEELVSWLAQQPAKTTATHRAALVAALEDLRHSLAAAA